MIENRIIVGRAEDAEVCLDHSTVSRRHAELVRGPYGHWWVHDLGSTNGTYVNGNPGKDRLLRPGDVVDIGSFSLVFRVPSRGSRKGLDPDDVPMSDDNTIVMSAVDIVTPIAGTPAALSSGQLSKVIGLGRTLLMFDDPVKRLTHACEFMVGEHFPADRAAVLNVVAGVPTEVVCGPIRRVEHDRRRIHFSRGVIKTMWDMRSAVVGHAGGAAQKKTLGGLQRSTGVAVKKLSQKEFRAPVAVMALPLSSWSEEVSCLYLELSPEKATSEWLALASFIAGSCEQAALASEMRFHGRIAAFVERELDMARQIQDGLLPRALQFAGLDTAVRYDPCRWVGGDYVDVMALPNGRVLLTIADVCGKGLQAALVSSSLHTMVRATAGANEDLPTLMTRFNTYFSSYLPDHSFVTMIGLILDPETGEIEIGNAGHPAGLIISTAGDVVQLESTSSALAMMNVPIETRHALLTPDDVIVLYTDGLTEAANEAGVPYGVDRLSQAVIEALEVNPKASADVLCDAIRKSVESHSERNLDVDDRAWLVARRVR
jgi:hypothetical protein